MYSKAEQNLSLTLSLSLPLPLSSPSSPPPLSLSFSLSLFPSFSLSLSIFSPSLSSFFLIEHFLSSCSPEPISFVSWLYVSIYCFNVLISFCMTDHYFYVSNVLTLLSARSQCGKQNAKRRVFMTDKVRQICTLEYGVSLSCKRGSLQRTQTISGVSEGGRRFTQT